MSVAHPGWWPGEAATTYDDLVAYRLVGASLCADRITDALVAVARRAEKLGLDVEPAVTDAGTLFCRLKPDTALYANVAACLSRAGRSGRATEVCEAAHALSAYRRDAQAAVVRHATEYLEDAETLLAHDFSSMVVRILQELGARRPRRIVVTAAEPLGQGPRVARAATAAGHRVTYTPDMSVARVVDGVDAFVTGVESFYADGSLANTVGTRMLGLLCRDVGVPVIAPAELLKYDRQHPTAAEASLEARLLHPWPGDHVDQSDLWELVEFVLDAVPAPLVTSYVSEQGVLAPRAVASTAQAVLRTWC